MERCEDPIGRESGGSNDLPVSRPASVGGVGFREKRPKGKKSQPKDDKLTSTPIFCMGKRKGAEKSRKKGSGWGQNEV